MECFVEEGGWGVFELLLGLDAIGNWGSENTPRTLATVVDGPVYPGHIAYFDGRVELIQPADWFVLVMVS